MLYLIVPHTKAHSHKAALSQRYSLLYRAATSDKTAGADVHITIKDSTRCYVAVVPYVCAVLYQGTGIDDAVRSHPRPSVDNGSMHHDRTFINGRMTRNIRRWRNDYRQLIAKFVEQCKKTHALIRRFDLAYGNEGVAMDLSQLRQPVVGCDHPIAEVFLIDLPRHADQPNDPKLTMLLDYIDARVGVSAGTNQN